jgi:hypothetical protein
MITAMREPARATSSAMSGAPSSAEASWPEVSTRSTPTSISACSVADRRRGPPAQRGEHPVDAVHADLVSQGRMARISPTGSSPPRTATVRSASAAAVSTPRAASASSTIGVVGIELPPISFTATA